MSRLSEVQMPTSEKCAYACSIQCCSWHWQGPWIWDLFCTTAPLINWQIWMYNILYVVERILLLSSFDILGLSMIGITFQTRYNKWFMTNAVIGIDFSKLFKGNQTDSSHSFLLAWNMNMQSWLNDLIKFRRCKEKCISRRTGVPLIAFEPGWNWFKCILICLTSRGSMPYIFQTWLDHCDWDLLRIMNSEFRFSLTVSRHWIDWFFFPFEVCGK